MNNKENFSDNKKIDKLDDLLLLIPSIMGIMGIFIQLVLNVFVFLNEAIYYVTVPILFFLIFMPIYIGYWRGALTKNSITERVRGWIYLYLGTFMYLFSIGSFIILLILIILFSSTPNNLIYSIIILFIINCYIMYRVIRVINPFVKSLFNLCGKSPISSIENIFIRRTYLSVTAYAIFFYFLVISVLQAKYFGDLTNSIIRLFAIGGPVLYFAIVSEGKTIKSVDNENYLQNSDINIVNQYFIKLIIFSILSFLFLVVDIFYNNLISSFCMHIFIGFTFYFLLNYSIEKIPFLKSKGKKQVGDKVLI